MSPQSAIKVWVLSLLLVVSITNTSFAQRRGGGGAVYFGGGGTHHHHHHHGGGGYYGGGYGGGFYGRGYGYPNSYWGYGGTRYRSGSGLSIGIYSAPQYYVTPQYYSTPQYVPAPVYSTPSYSPSYSAPSPVDAAPQRVYDNGPIVITSPTTNDKAVDYSLNGTRFTIEPGQSQKFKHDRDWIVEFNRGSGRGTGEYVLKSATYKFKQTANGWELFEAASSPAVREPLPPADDPIGPAPKPAPDPTTARPKPGAEAETVIPKINALKVAPAPRPSDDAPKPAAE